MKNNHNFAWNFTLEDFEVISNRLKKVLDDNKDVYSSDPCFKKNVTISISDTSNIVIPYGSVLLGNGGIEITKMNDEKLYITLIYCPYMYELKEKICLNEGN